MLSPHVPGFTTRPIRLEDAEVWARYACLPEVEEHTSSTAATADDVRAVIQRTLAGEHGSPAYFSDRGRPFQADRGRRFIAIVDDQSARE